MQPGGGVSPRSKAHNYRACGRPGRAPIWSKGTSQQMLRPRNWWATITHMLLTREGFVYPAGRDGAVCSKRTVGYATAGKHANRIGSKSPGNGGAELPARQGCDDFSCRVRGTQYTSADYTASMNNYVFLASVGRTGVCYDNAAVESFNATRAGKNSSTRRIYRTRRKAIKEVASWIEH